MATTANAVYFAQHHLTLFPAPLRIRKKSRRLNRLRFPQRKPTRGHAYPPHGPLDDIIDEITGDIWHSAPCDTFDTFDYFALIEGQFPWAVTPLPLSRVPSQQPLAVRKTRNSNSNSRSTASSSTFSDAMASSGSRGSTGCERNNSGSSENAPRPTYSPFPALSNATTSASHSTGPSSPPAGLHQSAAEQQLSTILEGAEGPSKPSRPQLRKRFFSLSNSMDKLRLKTNDWGKKDPSSNPNSPTYSSSSASPKDTDTHEIAPTNVMRTEDVAAWMEKNGRRASIIGAVCSQAAKKYPSPLEYRQELPSIDDAASESAAAPASVLAASVRVIPETKILSSEEVQTFWVAVEVEGVQHNRHALSDQGIDVVFLVDSAYHVTADCLNRALDLAVGSLYELKKCDRVALYTTHCTHEAVTSTVPDMWYPLSPVDNVATETFRDMVSDIRSLGTQAWKWPRPNPAMDDVITSIAQSLEGREPKKGRTHILLLSPVPRGLHRVSKCYPSLHVHQINPAVLPLYKDRDPEKLACFEPCCLNITLNNMAYYQSTSDRVRQILKYARSEKPLGRICNVHIDLRRRPGCEVLRYEGSPDIPHLRLGQIHTFFAELKVHRSQTEEMDLTSPDPIRDSSLAANNMRQDLKNAKVLGASKAHLLSVQVMHQSSMMPSTHWSFAESPLLIFKELGRMSVPTDRALDLYKRRIFHMVSRLDVDSPVDEIGNLDIFFKPGLKESAERILDNVAKELDSHRDIVEYGRTSRKNLPSCPGPVSAPYAHDFLVEKWEARKKKRAGMAVNQSF